MHIWVYDMHEDLRSVLPGFVRHILPPLRFDFSTNVLFVYNLLHGDSSTKYVFGIDRIHTHAMSTLFFGSVLYIHRNIPNQTNTEQKHCKCAKCLTGLKVECASVSVLIRSCVLHIIHESPAIWTKGDMQMFGVYVHKKNLW